MKRLSTLLGLLACCAMLAACNTTASTAAGDGTLKAKRIVITDEKGNNRIVIGRITTGQHKQTYGAIFLDADGKHRIGVGTNQQGDAAVVLYDPNETVRVLNATFVDDGDAGTVYFDDDGVVRVRMGSDNTGEAGMDLLDGDEEVVRGIRSYRYSSDVTETHKE